MYRTREQDLPFRGSSYNFVGADNGDVAVSVFLFRGLLLAVPVSTTAREAGPFILSD